MFEDNIRRLERELQCLKRAKVMHTIELRAMAGKLKAGDTARREAAHELEAGNASRQEVIRGLEASHHAGRQRG